MPPSRPLWAAAQTTRRGKKHRWVKSRTASCRAKSRGSRPRSMSCRGRADRRPRPLETLVYPCTLSPPLPLESLPSPTSSSKRANPAGECSSGPRKRGASRCKRQRRERRQAGRQADMQAGRHGGRLSRQENDRLLLPEIWRTRREDKGRSCPFLQTNLHMIPPPSKSLVQQGQAGRLGQELGGPRSSPLRRRVV